jgi:ligand-binding sensor domain-containing protein
MKKSLHKFFVYMPFSLMTMVMLVVFTGCNRKEALSNTGNMESSSTTSKEKIFPKHYGQNDAVRCGFLDSKGDLWFGTNNEGAYRFDGKSFTHYSKENGLFENKVNVIVEDLSGNLWFGTSEGLYIYNGSTFEHVTIPWSDTSSVWLDKVYPIVNPNEVLSIYIDKNEGLWIGTNGNGAYYFDGREFTAYLTEVGAKYDDSLHHNIITHIAEDDSGNIWFTSLSHAGVTKYNGMNFTQYLTEHGLSDDMVRTAYKDRAGNMWFGSNGNRKGGLDRYDGSSFLYFNKEHGICNTNIQSIYEDASGKFWLGSGRGGICIYDGKEFNEFVDEHGHAFDNILFIMEDTFGNIWFGGSYGKLFQYNGETLKDFTSKSS